MQSTVNNHNTSITESVAYEWGNKGRGGLIRYFYDEQKHPSTKVDVISLGFITPLDTAVLLRVDSGTTLDYLEVDIVRQK